MSFRLLVMAKAPIPGTVKTRLRAGEAGLSVYEGVPWRDVDEPGDLARLRGELDACPDLAPRTAGVLRMR